MKKGLELPVNMIVIIAIAVLVLVVIAAFFISGAGEQIDRIKLENTFNDACTTFRSTYSCSSQAISTPVVTASLKVSDPPEGKLYSLRELCNAKGIPATDNNACLRTCGCNA